MWLRNEHGGSRAVAATARTEESRSSSAPTWRRRAARGGGFFLNAPSKSLVSIGAPVGGGPSQFTLCTNNLFGHVPS